MRHTYPCPHCGALIVETPGGPRDAVLMTIHFCPLPKSAPTDSTNEVRS